MLQLEINIISATTHMDLQITLKSIPRILFTTVVVINLVGLRFRFLKQFI